MRSKDEKKKTAIYQAAMELVNTNGLAGTSMSKIAAAAGVSASTIYVYFENKEDMLNKLYLMAKEESSLMVFEGFDEAMGIRDGLGFFLRNYFRYMKENPVIFSFLQQYYSSPTISQEVREQGLVFYAPIVMLYEQGVKQGVVREEPMQLIQAFTMAPIEVLVQAHLLGELEVNDLLLDRAVEMAWSTVCA